MHLLLPKYTQFLAVKEAIKGEIQPLDQLPHCHDVDGIVKVSMRMDVVCVCVRVCMLFIAI